MYDALIWRRLWAVLLLGLVMTAAVLLFVTTPASAHPCDDNYTEQKDRENCWWRYWNNLSTPEDLMASAAAHPCDDNYTEQKDRENCWWRHWNNLSTPEDLMAPGDAPDGAVTYRSVGRRTAASSSGYIYIAPGDAPTNAPGDAPDDAVTLQPTGTGLTTSSSGYVNIAPGDAPGDAPDDAVTLQPTVTGSDASSSSYIYICKRTPLTCQRGKRW